MDLSISELETFSVQISPVLFINKFWITLFLNLYSKDNLASLDKGKYLLKKEFF
jgi:hypothetical protein